jgi:hypothetical protein
MEYIGDQTGVMELVKGNGALKRLAGRDDDCRRVICIKSIPE